MHTAPPARRPRRGSSRSQAVIWQLREAQQTRQEGDLKKVFGLVVVAVIAVSIACAGCASGGRSDPNPLSGKEFYVEPRSPAALQIRQWEEAGRELRAEE